MNTGEGCVANGSVRPKSAIPCKVDTSVRGVWQEQYKMGGGIRARAFGLQSLRGEVTSS